MKHRGISVFVFFLFFPGVFVLFAETPLERVGRLEKQLPDASPHERLNIILEIMKIQPLIKTEPERIVQLGNQGLKIVDQLGDSCARGTVLVHQSLGYWYSGQRDSALQALDEAETILQKCGDRRGLVDARIRLGLISHVDLKLKEALKIFLDALTLSREIGDEQRTAESLYWIGIVHHGLKNYETAFDFYTKALSTARHAKDIKTEALVYNNLGLYYSLKKKHRQALDYFQKSLSLFRTLEDDYFISSLTYNIGNLYNTLGKMDMSTRFIKESLDYTRRIGDEILSAVRLNSLARIEWKLRNFR
ncbi:MAG: tetratricopeptide repeat protein, partial [Candidatus Aureabacteria bacterium]|nr:tetratricopeptide repeat protein [Candidatus Auribacterota bacterium]